MIGFGTNIQVFWHRVNICFDAGRNAAMNDWKLSTSDEYVDAKLFLVFD